MITRQPTMEMIDPLELTLKAEYFGKAVKGGALEFRRWTRSIPLFWKGRASACGCGNFIGFPLFRNRCFRGH
ncbi:hypothetical protein V6N13_111778 [Hibiscus sabdariffa]